MVDQALLEQALKLSPSERVELADALLISVDRGDVPLTPEQEALLAERIAEADANPDSGRSATDVIADLRSRFL